MEFLIPFLIGVFIGAFIVLTIGWIRKKEAKNIAQELLAQTESEKIKDLELVIERLKESFSALSLTALSKNTEEFLKLANETLKTQTQTGEKELESKKKLIDQTLESITKEMQKVQDSIVIFEKDREQKFGELATQLKTTADHTLRLQETTNQLRVALASTKVRGQWGERMAEDVLRLAGFIEGINYQKQKALEVASGRPDYTFFLPQNLKVNMDVKFPLDNYLRYLEADNDMERENYKTQFFRDVKGRIKEVTSRDYINPEAQTVDYVMVFIPNEQVYGFIHENDSTILDEALKNKVVLCSPLTLYAILAIIRQAVDNFHLEQSATKILSLMGAFNKQWKAFLESLEKMGKKIDEAQKEFNSLTSTRRNQLERSLRQIEDLRQQKGISIDVLVLDTAVDSENKEDSHA
jgi:DNA recombination protein RmuC